MSWNVASFNPHQACKLAPESIVTVERHADPVSVGDGTQLAELAGGEKDSDVGGHDQIDRSPASAGIDEPLEDILELVIRRDENDRCLAVHQYVELSTEGGLHHCSN